MLTMPPISEDTHSSEASRSNTTKRTRTNQDADDDLMSPRVGKGALLVVSKVATSALPSGLTATRSSSIPDLAVADDVVGCPEPAWGRWSQRQRRRALLPHTLVSLTAMHIRSAPLTLPK